MNNALLDKKNAAFILGISPVTLDRYRKQGKLPFKQIGGLVKFTPEDIAAFIEASTVNGLETRSQK